ncbi:MAG: hypothetical protein AAGU32_04260 [Bacillota bacterium]
MTQFKRWLYTRFLPAWCKEDLISTNSNLAKTVAEQRHEIDRLNAYIDGLETAMRAQRRITIRNEVRP